MLKLVRKCRFLLLFIITILFCLFTALNAELKLSSIADLVFAIIFVTSLLVISNKEDKLLIWIIILGLIHLLQITLGLWMTHPALNALKSFFAMMFFLLLMIATLNLTLKDKSISITTLFGSLSGYLFIGLVFAYLYLMIYELYPQLFIGLQPYPQVRAIYYSFITLTTVGFGDVVTKSPIMQTLSWIEAFFGQAYMAIFITQLVSRYVTDDMSKIQSGIVESFDQVLDMD